MILSAVRAFVTLSYISIGSAKSDAQLYANRRTCGRSRFRRCDRARQHSLSVVLRQGQRALCGKRVIESPRSRDRGLVTYPATAISPFETSEITLTKDSPHFRPPGMDKKSQTKCYVLCEAKSTRSEVIRSIDLFSTLFCHYTDAIRCENCIQWVFSSMTLNEKPSALKGRSRHFVFSGIRKTVAKKMLVRGVKYLIQGNQIHRSIFCSVLPLYSRKSLQELNIVGFCSMTLNEKPLALNERKVSSAILYSAVYICVLRKQNKARLTCIHRWKCTRMFYLECPCEKVVEECSWRCSFSNYHSRYEVLEEGAIVRKL